MWPFDKKSFHCIHSNFITQWNHISTPNFSFKVFPSILVLSLVVSLFLNFFIIFWFLEKEKTCFLLIKHFTGIWMVNLSSFVRPYVYIYVGATVCRHTKKINFLGDYNRKRKMKVSVARSRTFTKYRKFNFA